MTNAEFKIQLEKRTVAFSVAVLKMLRKVPVGFDTRNIRDQVARSATAVGANYREANRAESKDDFIHKIAAAMGVRLTIEMTIKDQHLPLVLKI